MGKRTFGFVAAVGAFLTLLLPPTAASAEVVIYYPQMVVDDNGNAVGEAQFHWFESGMAQVTDYEKPVTFTYSIDFVNTSDKSFTISDIAVGNSAHIYSEPAGGTTQWDEPSSASVSRSEVTVAAGQTEKVTLTVSFARPNVMRLNSYGGVSGFGYLVDTSYTDAAGTPQSFTAYAAVGSAVPWNPNASSYGQNQSQEALNQFLYMSCAEDDAYKSITVCGTWTSLGAGAFGSFAYGEEPEGGLTLPPGVKPTPPFGGVPFTVNGSSSFGETEPGTGVSRIGGVRRSAEVAPAEGTSVQGQVCVAPAAPIAAVIVTLLITLLLGVFSLIWFEHRNQHGADARAGEGSIKNLTVFQIEALWNKLKGHRT